jgi:hypothetical protein
MPKIKSSSLSLFLWLNIFVGRYFVGSPKLIIKKNFFIQGSNFYIIMFILFRK